MSPYYLPLSPLVTDKWGATAEVQLTGLYTALVPTPAQLKLLEQSGFMEQAMVQTKIIRGTLIDASVLQWGPIRRLKLSIYICNTPHPQFFINYNNATFVVVYFCPNKICVNKGPAIILGTLIGKKKNLRL